jgi:hypothetical protein
MIGVVKKTVLLLLIALMAFSFVGCMTHEHIIGTGAQTGYTESAKQWYLLWGLIPLNSVDTKALSGGSENYKIVTSVSPLDAIISAIGASFTLRVRTVEVVK